MSDPLLSPLPPPPLGARPEGLLDILGVKSGGRFPQHLADNWLQPQIDLTDWYLDQRAVTVTGSLVASSIAATTVVATVPAQQNWLLRACSLLSSSSISGTVTRLGVTLHYTDPNNSPIQVLLNSGIWVGGDYLSAGLVLPRPIILGPNSRVTALCTAYAGTAGGTITAALRYVPLPL